MDKVQFSYEGFMMMVEMAIAQDKKDLAIEILKDGVKQCWEYILANEEKLRDSIAELLPQKDMPPYPNW